VAVREMHGDAHELDDLEQCAKITGNSMPYGAHCSIGHIRRLPPVGGEPDGHARYSNCR
jgi:hypothetical protein